VSVEPFVFCVGGVQLTVAEPVPVSVTAIENAGSGTLVRPSVTEITMFEVVPICEREGVPDSLPFEVLNVAHEGRFWMLNVSVSPLGSLAVGVNEYAVPATVDVRGVPLIVGAPLFDARTVTVKAGSDAVTRPSLTLITMFGNVPTFAAVGVPVSRPVDVLKLIHDGRFEIEKPSVLPSGSDAVGRKLYAVPTVAVAGGVPEIVGGRLVVLPPLVDVEIVNAGSDAVERPSVTEITMLRQVPAVLGTPSMRPEYWLKMIHEGLFAIVNFNFGVSGSVAVGVKR
jgi:hypothetical protein